MVFKTIFFTLFFSILTFTSNAQSLPEGKWNLFDADVLGHFYLCDGEQLVKSNEKGEEITTYKNNFLGEITQIDTYKGLKILVYHKETNTLIFLDNNLAQLGQKIDLTELGFFEIAAACVGIDDHIWIADQQTGQLLLLNNNYQVQYQGAVYKQYTLSDTILKFSARENLLLLITNKNELIIFDRFGTFVNKLFFSQIKAPFITSENLYFLSENTVIKTTFSTYISDTIGTVNNSVDAILESKNWLYLLGNNKIKKLNR